MPDQKQGSQTGQGQNKENIPGNMPNDPGKTGEGVRKGGQQGGQQGGMGGQQSDR
ncbi:MAG TPA: stress-induced protein [bacterium]